MTRTGKTIAFVGCGPKGLYALDSLCRVARSAPTQKLDVHIFEPSSHPGAGPIYDPGQPETLLMNFPAHMIDAWTDGRGPSLIAWLHDIGETVAAGDYVPRGVVGRYLAWCFDEITRNTPPNLRLTMHATQISGLRRVSGRWIVSPAGIAADEVLVTTGHQDWARSGLSGEKGMISSPFPIDDALIEGSVPPGASVACKGFALTFIDTMLALTEGRGGLFSADVDGFSYQPSGTEPGVIAPFSRSGRPMRAKVDADHFMAPQGTEFWHAQNDDFERLAATDDVTFRNDIWPFLLCVADSAIQNRPGAAAEFFACWQWRQFETERCCAELLKGYQVALGIMPPDIGWALGEAWRRCYPQLVRWISHRDLSRSEAAFFLEIAAEMERLAFGPPAQNVGKLICLQEAGLVSFDYLSGDLRADVTIDATIPKAGSAALSEPLAGLLRDGYVTVGSLGGLVVDAQAQALKNGVVTPGLSIIGRATEGCVLGNDTLSRSLHDLPERWAARVVLTPEFIALVQSA